MKREYLIEEDRTILDAMKRIDQNTYKILFIHKDGKLEASVTDGDIRRWILKKGDLQFPVKCVANFQPRYLFEKQAYMAMHVMKEYGIAAIPVVNENHIIKDIVFLNTVPKVYDTFSENVPVVIMAGGLGTRLSPYTSILPKPLIPIGDYPITEHIINEFLKYGCKQFYMIVNYKRNMIKAYFDELEKGYCLNFIDERKVLGTGGGLSLLKGKINDTFILTNCDILIDDDLTKAYKQHKESENLITLVCSLKNFTIPYGVVNVNEDGTIASMQEKPGMSFLINTGCYFVEPQVVEDMKYNSKADFPFVVEEYRKLGERIGIYPIGEEAWLDMGQLDELEKMKTRLGCIDK